MTLPVRANQSEGDGLTSDLTQRGIAQQREYCVGHRPSWGIQIQCEPVGRRGRYEGRIPPSTGYPDATRSPPRTRPIPGTLRAASFMASDSTMPGRACRSRAPPTGTSGRVENRMMALTRSNGETMDR